MAGIGLQGGMARRARVRNIAALGQHGAEIGQRDRVARFQFRRALQRFDRTVDIAHCAARIAEIGDQRAPAAFGSGGENAQGLRRAAEIEQGRTQAVDRRDLARCQGQHAAIIVDRGGGIALRVLGQRQAQPSLHVAGIAGGEDREMRDRGRVVAAGQSGAGQHRAGGGEIGIERQRRVRCGKGGGILAQGDQHIGAVEMEGRYPGRQRDRAIDLGEALDRVSRLIQQHAQQMGNGGIGRRGGLRFHIKRMRFVETSGLMMGHRLGKNRFGHASIIRTGANSRAFP